MRGLSTSVRSLCARLGLLLAGVLLTLVAQGQQIVADPDGESCRITPDCKPHKYEFKPGPGQTFLHWQVRGDLRLLSPDTQNPAEICSEGYGKGRITAHYYVLRWRREGKCRQECPDTVLLTLDYDLFKRFEAPGPLNGPQCARGGEEVTYSVAPILTDWVHRRVGIGTDGYTWSGFPAGTVLAFSGDSSSVRAMLPDHLPAGLTVRVQVGRCNGGKPLELPVALGQQLASAISGPDCATATAPYRTITINTLPGTSYLVSLPAGWSFANGSTGSLTGDGTTQAVHFQIGSTMGNILLTATGGCSGPQTVGWIFTWQP